MIIVNIQSSENNAVARGVDPVLVAQAHSLLATGAGPALLRELGVPVSVVAPAIGVTPQTLYRWHSKATQPHPRHAAAYAAFINNLVGN